MSFQSLGRYPFFKQPVEGGFGADDEEASRRADPRIARPTAGVFPNDSFRQGQRVVQVDSKIANSAVHLGMPKQKLNSAQVACLLVNLGNLGAPHRMGAIRARFKTDRENPVAHDPRILAGGQMRAGMDSAGPKIFATDHFWILDPTLHRKSRGFGDLEAYRLASLALRHRGAFFDAACGVNIVHLQADQIATKNAP